MSTEWDVEKRFVCARQTKLRDWRNLDLAEPLDDFHFGVLRRFVHTPYRRGEV